MFRTALLDAGAYEGASGVEYAAGFIVFQDNGTWLVPIANTETEFANLDAAEEYLWREWCESYCVDEPTQPTT